jgi:TnpA family transposase
MAQVWGMGRSASADGQFFPAARQGEAMNAINARYGNDPGIKAYTHVNDRLRRLHRGPFQPRSAKHLIYSTG